MIMESRSVFAPVGAQEAENGLRVGGSNPDSVKYVSKFVMYPAPMRVPGISYASVLRNGKIWTRIIRTSVAVPEMDEAQNFQNPPNSPVIEESGKEPLVVSKVTRDIRDHAEIALTRQEKRDRRDLVQREIAARKTVMYAKAAWKSLPERLRAEKIRKSRDAKYTDNYEQAGLVDMVTKSISDGVCRAFQPASNQASQVISEAHSLLGSVTTSFDAMRPVVESVTNSAQGIAHDLKNTTSAIDAAVQWLRDTINTLKTHFTKWVAVPIAALISWLKQEYCAFMNLVGSAVAPLIEGILPNGFFSTTPEGSNTEQSGFIGADTVQSAIKLAVKFVTAPLGWFVPRDIFRWMDKELLMKDSTLNSALMTALKAINWVSLQIQKAIGVENPVEIFEFKSRQVYAWAKSVDRIVATAMSKPEEYAECENLQHTGMQFRESWNGTAVYPLVVEKLRDLKHHMSLYSSIKMSSQNIRQEPATVFLYGIPGIAKTSLLMFLCAKALIEGGSVEPAVNGRTEEQVFDDVTRNVWSKGSSEYFEGYIGQKCFIIDDFGQQRTAAAAGTTENVYMQLINQVNVFAYNLNMASLEMKAKTYFNSDLIIATTNCPQFEEETTRHLHDPGAFYRRIHLGYEFLPKPQYRNADGKVNTTLLGEFTRKYNSFPFSWYYVQKHDFQTGKSDGVNIEATTMVQEVIDLIKEKRDFHHSRMDAFKSFVGSLARGEQTNDGSDFPVPDVEVSEEPKVIKESLFKRTKQNIARKTAAMEKKVHWPEGADYYEVVTEQGWFSKPKSIMSMFVPAAQQTVVNHDTVWSEELQMFKRIDEDVFYDVEPIPVEDVVIEEDPDKYRTPSLAGAYVWGDPTVRDRQKEKWMKIKQAQIQSWKNVSQKLQDDAASIYSDFVPTAYHQMRNLIPGWMNRFLPCTLKNPQEFADKGLSYDAFADYKLQSEEEDFEVSTFVFHSTAYLCSLVFGAYALIASANVLKQVGTFLGQVVFPTISHAFERFWAWLKSLFNVRPSNYEQMQHRLYNQRHRLSTGSKTVVDKIRKHLIALCFVDDENEKVLKIGNILSLGGNLYVMPQHFWRNIHNDPKTYAQLILYYIAGKDSRDYTAIEITREELLSFPVHHSPNRDLAFFTVPRSIIPCLHTVLSESCFVEDEEELKKYQGRPVVLHHATPDGTKIVYDSLRSQSFQVVESIVTYNEERTVRSVTKGLVNTGLDTQPAYCGSVLVFDYGSIPSSSYIIGVHTAANRAGDSYQTYLTRDILVEAKSALADSMVITMDVKSTLTQSGFTIIDVPMTQAQGSIVEVCGVSPCPKPLTSTSIHKEDPDGGWVGMFGSNPRKPAWLRNFEAKDGSIVQPWLKAVSKYATPVKRIRFPYKSEMFAVAVSEFSRLTGDLYKGQLSYKEAVFGSLPLSLGGVPRGTSPGFPFTSYGKKNKQFLFTDQNELSDAIESVDTEEEVNFIIESASRGIRLNHFYTDFLKDELRPKDKVDEGKTRLVSGSPLAYTIAVRMAFGAFIAAFYKCRIHSGMAPGIKTVEEWDKLVTYLRFGKDPVVGFDGDYSAFDASEQPDVLWQILDFINDWYGDDGHAMTRRILFYDLVESLHITSDGVNYGQVVRWTKSLPSGHPLTTIVNSFYSLFCCVVGYGYACEKKRNPRGFVNFWRDVRPIVYGDDNLMSLRGEVQNWFNQDVMAEAMSKKMHLTYTDALKGADLMANKKLEQMSFLKRGFRQEFVDGQGVYVAPLDIQSIIYRNYVYKNAATRDADRMAKADTMLVELSMHDQETWQKYAPSIYKQMSKERKKLVSSQYPTFSFGGNWNMGKSLYLNKALSAAELLEPWDNTDVASTELCAGNDL